MLSSLSKDEEDSATLCRLILKSYGQSGFEEIRSVVNANAHCINTAGSTGETPLFLAVNQRNVPLVKFLLVSKADPNGTSANGRTALHELASSSSHATERTDRELIELLMVHNASVTTHDENHSKPVDIARMYNAPQSIQELLSRAGHSNATSSLTTTSNVGFGFTPSRMAHAVDDVPSVTTTSSSSSSSSSSTTRMPATPELQALFRHSAENKRLIQESQKAVERARAAGLVDTALARAKAQRDATDRRAMVDRIEAAFPDTHGPYKLLYEKALAELRDSQKSLRNAMDDLKRAEGQIEELERINREMSKDRDSVNLETAGLVEYKRLSQARLQKIQSALAKLKSEIKDSDEVFFQELYCHPTHRFVDCFFVCCFAIQLLRLHLSPAFCASGNFSIGLGTGHTGRRKQSTAGQRRL